MDNLNLAADEAINYKSQKIILSGTGYEAILTNKRFLLEEIETGTVREDLDYSAISLASAAFNKLKEPVIILSLTAPDGNTRQLELIFVQPGAGQNVQDRDRCLTALKARNVPVDGMARPSSRSLARNDGIQGNSGKGTSIQSGVPEWTDAGTSVPRHQAQQETPPRSPITLIITALIIIGLLIGIVVIAGNFMKSQPVPANNTIPVKETTIPDSLIPSQSTAIEPTATPSPADQTLPMEIPLNGIWLQVSYPGNFSGTAEAGGWMTALDGSGTRLYQLPVQNTVVRVAVSKLDGSGNTLEAKLFNGGTSISEFTTTKPWGLIDANTAVGPALINSPVVSTTTPVITVSPTMDPLLSQHSVPDSGVWVRVTYAGNFTGSISANGLERVVKGSGDKFYQMSIKSGIIDGYMEKEDGSANNLVIQVYKDGLWVATANTSKPQGIAEIHAQI